MTGHRGRTSPEMLPPRREDYADTAVPGGSGISPEVFRRGALLRPYQLRPLFKFARSDGRLLIADEAGLGKTTEAAFIIANEVLKHRAARLMVICSTRQRDRWRSELGNRFGLPFTVVSGARALRDLADPDRPFRHIVPLDSLKASLDQLVPSSGLDLDLLVIDGVHNAVGEGEGAKMRKVCMGLSSRSRKVVGISASPDHLRDDDLFQIIEAMAPGRLSRAAFENEMLRTARLDRAIERLRGADLPASEAKLLRDEISELASSVHAFRSDRDDALANVITTMAECDQWPSDPVLRQDLWMALDQLRFLSSFMTATSRREVGEKRRREVVNLEVRLSDEALGSTAPGASEAEVFRDLDRLFSEKFTHLHRRQLGSSMPALTDLLDNGMARLDFCSEGGITSAEASVARETRERCRDLARRLRSVGTDSKWELLRGTIEELRTSGAAKKVIVFTQWLPTCQYLRNRLYEANVKLFPALGESGEEAQAAVMRKFQEHEGFCVLLATDVLPDGADIHTANCVVNYDLPYDPREMERRAERVDRPGQAEDVVRVVNLIAAGSVDEGINRLLLSRSRAADRAAGELPDVLTEGIDELDVERSMETIQRINEYLEGGRER